MELKNNKSTWAALATLGVTAIAAGATAFIKIREKRRKQQEESQQEESSLTAEQQMVYNEAVSAFKALNNRIYELRQYRQQLQPLVQALASENEKAQTDCEEEDIKLLADDIINFQTTQLPFINACLATINDNGTTFADYVRAAVGGTFDQTLDEGPAGSDIADGTPIKFVLKLGYYFPQCSVVSHPVKSIVIV